MMSKAAKSPAKSRSSLRASRLMSRHLLFEIDDLGDHDVFVAECVGDLAADVTPTVNDVSEVSACDANLPCHLSRRGLGNLRFDVLYDLRFSNHE
jgi:hypothetical protein